ncbi:hypothetical protein [Aeromicrobium piscarium]|uniref:CBU-0592-like domain-containing protein n=1 Tax=Aeromicrobium piscarium TaxID=2590901 RepID=A0A554SBF1_9ACTN|nr:hypothetical protein [Aeromicrobium piscarium]TSD63673.1 hypothetical protein FNM00_08685 [Aeromicrobium piscarium]
MDGIVAGVLGWMGTIGTFAAYVLLWRGRLMATSLTYAAMNTVGGVLAGTAGALYGAWPVVASNVIWAGVGAHTLLATIRARRRQVIAL